MADVDQMATDYITSNGKILFKSYFVSKIVLTFCEKKIVLVTEKHFWNSRLKA